jgi:hypothetical protein
MIIFILNNKLSNFQMIEFIVKRKIKYNYLFIKFLQKYLHQKKRVFFSD